MSKDRLLQELGNEGYRKLREVVKRNTALESLNKDNIETTKEALRMLSTWLGEVYQLDVKPIDMDEDGTDIENLFKTS